MAETQDSPLSFAISHGYTSEIRSLIASGVDLNQHGGFGWTPLIQAAYTDQLETVKMLIQAGADLDLVDESGNTALITAARKERQEIVEALIQAGADCMITNNAGNSALDVSEDDFISNLLKKTMSS